MFSQEFESIRGVEVSKLGAPKAPFPMFKSVKKILKALYRIERAFNIRRVLKKFRPDIVHAHFLTDSGWIASWTGYHPLILTAHGSDVLVHPKHSLIDRMVVRFSLHKADVVTIVAQHMKRKIIELLSEKKIMTTRNISIILDINWNTAVKLLFELEIEGKIIRNEENPKLILWRLKNG